LDPNVKNDTFNIGPDEEFMTIKALAEAIMSELDCKDSIVYMPDRPKEV
jgi:nucleoside-diphosphate-sugar epimerase